MILSSSHCSFDSALSWYILFSNFYFVWLGIELVLGTKVISADVRRKTLLTSTGETISYKTLIIATGARVLDLFVLLFIFLFQIQFFMRPAIFHQKNKIYHTMINLFVRRNFISSRNIGFEATRIWNTRFRCFEHMLFAQHRWCG